MKSQFGFHIIKLEDTREAQFPPLDEVKPQIEQRLSQKKLQQFQEELRSQGEDGLQVHEQRAARAVDDVSCSAPSAAARPRCGS